VDIEGLMPDPGRVDVNYIEHLAETVDNLTTDHTFVVLDFHQDGFAPIFNGNGFPNWMAITDGLPNPPDAVFPLYYVQNPAMQRAFDHFWANSPGPAGVGLQDSFMKGLEAVVGRFAGNPWVLGYEAMNEPWPGTDWTRCTTASGCPDLEARLLQPFYERSSSVVRRFDQRQLLFVEPFVLFNFGRAPTSVPGFAGPICPVVPLVRARPCRRMGRSALGGGGRRTGASAVARDGVWRDARSPAAANSTRVSSLGSNGLTTA
jgi:endoglycosylceramidase